MEELHSFKVDEVPGGGGAEMEEVAKMMQLPKIIGLLLLNSADMLIRNNWSTIHQKLLVKVLAYEAAVGFHLDSRILFCVTQ